MTETVVKHRVVYHPVINKETFNSTNIGSLCQCKNILLKGIYPCSLDNTNIKFLLLKLIDECGDIRGVCRSDRN